MPDYMFVNMFRITNIMNNFISNLNNYNSYQQEVLFEGNQGSGDINLNQPFANFPFIIIANRRKLKLRHLGNRDFAEYPASTDGNSYNFSYPHRINFQNNLRALKYLSSKEERRG